MTVRAAVLALAALLAAGPAAGAMEFREARVCGPDACADVSRDTAFAAVDGGPSSGPPSRRAPFYELRVTVAAEGGPEARDVAFAVLVVPGAGRARTEDGAWMRLRPGSEAALRRAAAGVAPFPARRLDLSSRVVAAEPLGPPGPMDLRTPGADDPVTAAGGGGPGLLVLLGAGLAIVLAATAAAWRLARRGGTAPQS
jgi:hypothetical protein